jgi:uncharacterized protein (DUF1015 family)
MADVRPFRAITPRDDLAPRVIAPPYDVLDDAEARALAQEPLHFVHVTRAEVDLPPGTDAHSEAAYAQARANLDRFLADGTLQEDGREGYWLYGLVMGAHHQLGVLGAASVAEYDDGRIRKHELTRPDKEDDRTHHMEVLDAQVGLVFLACRADADLAAFLDEVAASAPRWRVTTEDGVHHALWRVPDARTEELRAILGRLDRLYIADGHHRSAAASRVHARRRDDASATFLAGIFPDDRLQILPYNRVVLDRAGLSPEALRAAIAARFDLTPGDESPPTRGTVRMYLDGAWWTLRARSDLPLATDPVSRLDVSVLQDHLLAPILGIDDPRRSERIRFVGGIKPPSALKALADASGGVAFLLHPTTLHQLFDVADADLVMPPKSTWFEPKLREGVVSQRLG